jgi:hypothetical protein
MEKLKDPSNENYFSTSSKGIFLKIRNDSLWVPIKDLNSHYSLIEEFTNQNQFPIKVNGS